MWQYLWNFVWQPGTFGNVTCFRRMCLASSSGTVEYWGIEIFDPLRIDVAGRTVQRRHV